MKKYYTYIPFVLIIGLVFYFTYDAYASMTGRVMRTSTFDGGCGGSGCHGTSSSSATSLSLQSGSLIVEPNSTNDYTIRLSNSTKQKAGVNIAVKTTITGSTNIGTLEAPVGSGLQVLVDELTHTSPKDISSGNADFSFKWKAPALPGKYFLRAAGNAVNADNEPTGDQWNWMTPVEVIVRGLELNEPKSTQNFCAGSPLIVKWTSAGIEDIKIELSTNGGNSWGITLNPSFKAVGGNWTWNIPTDFQQGPNFRIRISDLSNPERISEMTGNFGIYGQFSIVEHPQSKQLCPGESLTLFVRTQGNGLKYQWRKNGFNLAGQTDSVLTLSNVNSGNAGFYGVVVSSNCYSPIVSAEANIEVHPATVIKKQPVSIITCTGNTAIYQIEADGHFVTYQWFKDNREIKNATSPELKILDVTTIDLGNYYCEVTGTCGSIKSNVVNLTLNSEPMITKQPVNLTICEKKDVTFSIAASGLQNSYEWYFNNSKISTSNNPDFILKNVGLQNSGEYYCIVRNNCGNPVKSNISQLTVNLLPKILSQPQKRMVMVGDKVEFSVTAENVKTYQWQKDGKNISGANESTYIIESSQVTDNGDYQCIIANDCGNITTSKANLLVVEPEPGPRIKFSSTIIDLGNVYDDLTVDSLLTGFITNIGNQTLVVDSLILKNAVDTIKVFELLADTGISLEPNETANIQIKVIPDTLGRKTARLNIYSNSIGEIPFIEIIANISKWDMISNRQLLDFDEVLVGQSDSLGFRVFNQSDDDITIDDLNIECDDNIFSILSPELPAIVKAKSSKDLKVGFYPTEGKNYDCELSVNFYRTNKNLKVQLMGSGKGTSVEDFSNIQKFEVFPNPTSNGLKLEFSLIDNSDYNLDIVDNSGKIIYSTSGKNFQNIHQILWDGKDNNGNEVAAGSYSAILSSSKYRKYLNIILIK